MYTVDMILFEFMLKIHGIKIYHTCNCYLHHKY